MPKILPSQKDIQNSLSNELVLRLPSFLGLSIKDFCELLGYTNVWLARIKKDIDTGKKDAKAPVVSLMNKNVIDALDDVINNKSVLSENNISLLLQCIDLFLSIYLKKVASSVDFSEVLLKTRTFETLKEITKNENRKNMTNLVSALITDFKLAGDLSYILNESDFTQEQIDSFYSLTDFILSKSISVDEFLFNPQSDEYKDINDFIKNNNISLSNYSAFVSSGLFQKYLSDKKDKMQRIEQFMKKQGVDLHNFIALSGLIQK